MYPSQLRAAVIGQEQLIDALDESCCITCLLAMRHEILTLMSVSLGDETLTYGSKLLASFPPPLLPSQAIFTLAANNTSRLTVMTFELQACLGEAYGRC